MRLPSARGAPGIGRRRGAATARHKKRLVFSAVAAQGITGEPAGAVVVGGGAAAPPLLRATG